MLAICPAGVRILHGTRVADGRSVAQAMVGVYAPTMAIDLQGKRLRLTTNSSAGVARAGETIFLFEQRGDVFWGTYHGGHIARGVLVGRHTGAEAVFWFQQLSEDGSYRAGVATSVIETAPDGRVLMRDRWRYTEGAVGEGDAVLVEIGEGQDGPD